MTDNSKKIVDFIEDYGWEVLGPLCILSIGLIKILWQNLNMWGWITLVSLTLLYVYSTYKIIKRRKRMSELEERVVTLDEDKQHHQQIILKYQKGYENMLRSYLSIIFSKLELTDDERISIYHQYDNVFAMIGRFSSNPALNQRGRNVYPNDEGFICLGYQTGQFFINGLANPNTDEQRYFTDVMEKCNINIETLEKLTMKSRSYSTRAMSHPVTQERVAIVVIESQRYDFNKEDEINSLFSELEQQVVSYIYYSDDIRPELTFAAEQGM